MKKALTLGAASAILAMLPVAGVFAATTTNVVDDISATVQQGCTITRDGRPDGVDDSADASASFARTATLTAIAGQTSTKVSTATVTVTCSDPGWNVVAKAADTTLTDTAESDKGTAIAAGTSGTSSWWSYEVNYTIGTASQTSGTAAAITTTGAVVVPATANATENGNEANHGTFTPSYQFYAQPNQKSGTYTGQVTYTVNMPAVTPGA